MKKDKTKALTQFLKVKHKRRCVSISHNSSNCGPFYSPSAPCHLLVNNQTIQWAEKRVYIYSVTLLTALVSVFGVDSAESARPALLSIIRKEVLLQGICG